MSPSEEEDRFLVPPFTEISDPVRNRTIDRVLLIVETRETPSELACDLHERSPTLRRGLEKEQRQCD